MDNFLDKDSSDKDHSTDSSRTVRRAITYSQAYSLR